MSLKKLLKQYKILPNKKLCQNFLICKDVLEKIINAAKLNSQDTVLEIGPGLGILTKELSKKAGKVIAIEKDTKLAEAVRKELRGCKNVEIIEGDILEIQNSKVKSQKRNSKFEIKSLKINSKFKIQNSKFNKLVANLPYNIATEVIRIFLENKKPPELMILMIQKEVGQKICSAPPKMSKLAVLCQFYGDAKIIAQVSKRCFYPQPKVDSAILKIIPYKLQFSHQFCKQFAKIVKAGFSYPRKHLKNNLTQLIKTKKKRSPLTSKKIEEWLSQNNIQPSQRPETLSVDDWIRLTKTFLNRNS